MTRPQLTEEIEGNIVATPRRWMTWDTASEYTTLHRDTLKRLSRMGSLPVSRIGGRTVVDVRDLDELLVSRKMTGRVKS